MDKAMERIAQRCTPDQGARALSEKREVTHPYELKVVAERFRTTVFNWDEEAVLPFNLFVNELICQRVGDSWHLLIYIKLPKIKLDSLCSPTTIW